MSDLDPQPEGPEEQPPGAIGRPEERLSGGPEPDRGTGTPETDSAPSAVPPAPTPPISTPWGFIDEEGAVHIRGGRRLGERVIGKIGRRTPEAVLAFYAERFAQLERRANRLETEIRSAKNKARYLRRVSELIEEVTHADALGDFDALLDRLERLQDEVRAFEKTQRARKEELCALAESLADSTDWRGTTEKLKALQSEWKSLGALPREQEQELWKRFRAALDTFFRRRDEDRARRKEQQERARATKIDLCEQAEALAESTDWAAAAGQHAALMAAWKAAGWAGRGEDERLWQRFRAARQRFFERRKEDRERRRRELQENKRLKDELCEQAEALEGADDLDAACERVKELQARWKEIGPVPRKESEAQWKRFRAACNRVFEKARRQRPRRRRTEDSQAPVAPGSRENIERLRESIVRDQGHLDRWRRAVGEREDGTAEALRAKIAEMERQLAAKREELERLERELRSARD
ncbi:MAG: DUF349 domain-containing protein [Acidobacteria bacterium]|nr:MAG: DUF349 domain-containing protein [Acidobacteriota bacterium]